MPNKLTQEEFLAKAVAVHGVGRYDYSQTVYVNGSSKVRVVCPVHGVFEQLAAAHIRGFGCRFCANDATRALTTQSTSYFINKAQQVHNKRYDYSQSVYISANGKVVIKCYEHGLFDIKPSLHYKGKGCPKCGKINSGRSRTHTIEQFIEKARAKHGFGTYDYSQVEYKTHRDEVSIICPQHGVFKQIAINHTEGRGCPKCNPQAAVGRDRFIARSQTKHGVDAYDYSQVAYVNADSDVTIICSKHGPFEQRAGHHMYRGSRCPSCFEQDRKKSWIERAYGRESMLYLVKFFNSEECFYKVGLTLYSINQRYSHSLYQKYEREVLAIHRSKNALAVYEWEASILETFAHLRYRPRQEFPGATECFSSADEILAIFPL